VSTNNGSSVSILPSQFVSGEEIGKSLNGQHRWTDAALEEEVVLDRRNIRHGSGGGDRCAAGGLVEDIVSNVQGAPSGQTNVSGYTYPVQEKVLFATVDVDELDVWTAVLPVPSSKILFLICAEGVFWITMPADALKNVRFLMLIVFATLLRVRIELDPPPLRMVAAVSSP